jgi:hypothetical protein
MVKALRFSNDSCPAMGRFVNYVTGRYVTRSQGVIAITPRPLMLKDATPETRRA